MRHHLIPGLMALVLVPLTAATVLRLIPDPPPTELAFPRPTHRVAVAVEAAMRAEVASVSRKTPSIGGPHHGSMNAADHVPKMGVDRLPEDYSAFWDIRPPTYAAPTLNHLYRMDFEGRTRDGRTITATVRDDPLGEGSVVDFLGDAEAARLLGGKIADRLAHPGHPHESRADRAALTYFFGPEPQPATMADGTPSAPYKGAAERAAFFGPGPAGEVGSPSPWTAKVGSSPGIDPKAGPR